MLALASGLDDVVDYAEEASDFLGLYRVDAPMDQAIALTDTLAAAGREVAAALGTLGDLREATPHLVEIKRLENEGDRLLREGLTALFEGGVDPMVVIRWKDIFERVEEGIDACDRVAHVLRGIAVKALLGKRLGCARGRRRSARTSSACSSGAITRNASHQLRVELRARTAARSRRSRGRTATAALYGRAEGARRRRRRSRRCGPASGISSPLSPSG